jgi:glucosamine-6-phosphate isomerase
MKLISFKTELDMTRAIAGEIEKTITHKPDSLVCIAGGHSPLPVIKMLVSDASKGKYPSDQFRFVSLDEWVGLGRNDSGSCIHDISENFLDPIGIQKGERLFFFDGLSADLNKECRNAENFIQKNGGIDVILLGIGMNGHIGFNEPPSRKSDGVRIVELSDISKTIGIKYFDKTHKLTHGITIGMAQILEAKKILVMVSGKHKQDIVRQAVEEKENEYCPVTLLRGHENFFFFTDQAAGQKIGNKHI